jgi:hypothetical protein
MINHELWRAIASGALTLMLAKMQAITHPDTLKQLNIKRDFLRWIRVELVASGSLSFAVSEGTLGLLWDEVQATADYEPELREQVPPMVENAAVSGGNTLTADAAPDDHTIMVYRFYEEKFALVGVLAENSQPKTSPSANYVLAMHNDDTGAVSLPSAFLTLTS